MKRDPTDLSLDDLVQRLCLACGIAPELLTDPDHFPGPDYHDEAGAAFWLAETVRAWVQAHAWAEILGQPRELERRVERLQVIRRAAGGDSLAPAAARVQALHDFVDEILALVFGN